MIITIELPLETGELLEKALDRARDTTASQTPELVDERWSAQQADALVTAANAYLSDNREKAVCTSDNYQNQWFFKQPDGCAVPSCGYQVQDMIDDDIDNNIIELSNVINNPSAEGFFTEVENPRAAASPVTLYSRQ